MKTATLKFHAEFAGIRRTTVIFKFIGTDFYSWNWLHNGSRTQVVVDIGEGSQHTFRDVIDVHRSYHERGQRHTRIVSSENPRSLAITNQIPLSEIDTWKPLDRITVPLDSSFPELTAGPQTNYQVDVMLNCASFDDAVGFDLISYVCRNSSLEMLKSVRVPQRSWQPAVGDLSLVVFAEPIRAIK